MKTLGPNDESINYLMICIQYPHKLEIEFLTFIHADIACIPSKKYKKWVNYYVIYGRVEE